MKRFRRHSAQRQTKKEELLKKILKKQKQKNLTVISPKMDLKRSYYKWLVLAKKDFVKRTIEKMLKNCKINEGKAAYIFWKKLQLEKQPAEEIDPLKLNQKQKAIYSATFQLVKFFEKNHRSCFMQAMRTMKGVDVGPLVRIMKKRFEKIMKISYDKLSNNTVYNKRVKFFSTLDGIMTPKIDPRFKALWNMKLISERKARRTENFVHVMESLLARNSVRSKSVAYSQMRKLLEYLNKVKILERVLTVMKKSRQQGAVSSLRTNSMMYGRKENSTIFMHNALKNLVNKYMMKPSMDQLKATVFRKRHATELLGNALHRIVKRKRKEVFGAIKEEFYSMMEVSVSYETFMVLSSMDDIFKNKVKERIHDALIPGLERYGKAEGILTSMFDNQNSKLRRGLKRLLGHNRIAKMIKSMFLKYAGNSSDLQRDTLNRLRNWNREFKMGMTIEDEYKFHSTHRFNSVLSNLFENRIRGSQVDFFNRLKMQDLLKKKILSDMVNRNRAARINAYNLLKSFAEKEKVLEEMRNLFLSKLVSSLERGARERYRTGFNSLVENSASFEQRKLLALSKILPENAAKDAFKKLVKNAMDLSTYQEMLLSRLFERYHPSDLSLLKEYYDKLRQWKESMVSNKAREMKLKYILSCQFKNLFGVARAFDIWRQYSDLEADFSRNSTNWAVSFQYLKGLESLNSISRVKKMGYFKDFKALAMPSISKKDQLVALLVERLESRKAHAFGNMRMNSKDEEIISKKIKKMFDLVNLHGHGALQSCFDNLRNWNKAHKIKVLAKIANFRGGQESLNRLRVHALEDRAREIEYDFRSLYLFNLLEDMRKRRLGPALRDMSSGPTVEEKVQNMFGILEKAALVANDGRLRGFFDVWKVKTQAMKEMMIAKKLGAIEMMNTKNRECSKLVAMERLSNLRDMMDMRDEMADILEDTDRRNRVDVLRNLTILRLVLAQYSKLGHSYSMLMKNKVEESSGDNLVVNSFSKSMGLWNSKLKSKMGDALNRMVKHSLFIETLYMKQKRMIEIFVSRIVSQKVSHCFSTLRTNSHQFSKVERLRQKFRELSRRLSQDAMSDLRKQKLSQDKNTIMAIFLNRLIEGKTRAAMGETLRQMQLPDSTLSGDDLSSLVQAVERALARPKRQAMSRIMTKARLRPETGALLLQRVLHKAEGRHSQTKAAAFSILRNQDIIKDLTLLYYFSFNKLMNLFKRKKQAALYDIMSEGRVMRCRSYYNNFWKWKLMNMEARFLEDRLYDKKNRLFNRFYLSKAISAMDNIFKRSKRVAMDAIKKDTGFEAGQGLYTYNDINTVVRNTAVLSGIYSILKKKRLLLLGMGIKKWRENTTDDGYSFTSNEKSGFIDSLYKKADLGVHYKRWLYCARLTKIIERCIIQRKIDFFNELVGYHGQNDDSVLHREDHFSNTLTQKANTRLKFKMAFMMLHSIFNSKLSSNFNIIYRHSSDASINQSKQAISHISHNSQRGTYSRNATGTRLVRKGDRESQNIVDGRLNKTYTIIKRGSNAIEQSIGERGTAQQGRGMTKGVFSKSNYNYRTNNFDELRGSTVDGQNNFDFRRQYSSSKVGNVNPAYQNNPVMTRKFTKLLNGILVKVFNKAKQRSFNLIHEQSNSEELAMNRENLERVKASYIDMVLKRGAVKILRNHREAQREALFRIFQNIA